jgi:hypothetical protein
MNRCSSINLNVRYAVSPVQAQNGHRVWQVESVSSLDLLIADIRADKSPVSRYHDKD